MSSFLREPQKHLLVGLVSVPVCLMFLHGLVVSSPYLTLSSLILINTSLLLRCLQSDMYGNVFHMVILLSALISKMLIYIFLLLNIISFYDLFDKICHISGMFYLSDWPQLVGFSLPSLKLSCSFANTRNSILLSL